MTLRDFQTCDRFDVRDRIGDIVLPALAVTGEHDQYTPPWYHEFLAEEIPTAMFEFLDECAHLSMLEQPAAFNATLTTFLDEHAG